MELVQLTDGHRTAPGLNQTCRLLTNGALKPLIVATAQTARTKAAVERRREAAMDWAAMRTLPSPFRSDRSELPYSKRLAARHRYRIVGESLDVQSYHLGAFIARANRYHGAIVLAQARHQTHLQELLRDGEGDLVLEALVRSGRPDSRRRRRFSVDIDSY